MIEKVKPYWRDVQVFTDDRGCFVPFSNALSLDLTKADVPVPKRAYVVVNYGRGVVRGFHFHEHEWKYFFVANGAAKFVAIDPNEPREQYVFVASARKPGLVVVPPYYANGSVSLEDQTIIVCLSSSTFDESIADDKRYDPFTWGDLWSVKSR